MIGGKQQEITGLLEKIVVFEVEFKEAILFKAQNLDEEKLAELKNILLEVERWQEEGLVKIMQENPDLYARVADAKKQAEQEIIKLYKQKIEEKDRQKMQIILNKIESI